MINARSIGGIVYKKDQGRVFWLIGKHSGYHKWIFPKGKVEVGESDIRAVKREVKEETGIKVRLASPKPVFEYTYYFVNRYVGQQKGRVKKTVTFYLLESAGGNLTHHDMEMSEVGWFLFPKALRTLAFSKEREALKKASQLV